jgi:hypothetical protein
MCGCHSKGSLAEPVITIFDVLAALVVLVVGASRGAGHQRVVEVDADAAAHADNHGLALHGLESLLEVFDQVLGDELDPLLGAPTSASSAAHLVLSFSLRVSPRPR